MERSESAKTFIIIGALMLFCVSLSYFFFMGQSLRLDEAQSLWQTSRSPGFIPYIVAQDVHVPLYHELLHFWRIYSVDTVTGARIMSLLLYLVSIPALYFLGKLAYGRKIALFATIIFGISPFMNWYGNEIRMYTLLTLMSIINQYFYLKILTKGKAIKGTNEYTLAWFMYGITAVLGVFVHYFFFLILLTQAVYYLLQRDLFPDKSFRNFFFTALCVTAGIVPWLLFVHFQGQAGFQVPYLPIPTSVNLFNTFSQFLFGFQNDNLNTIFLSLWPITIIMGLLVLRRDTRLSPVSGYFLLLVTLSVAVAFCVSFIVPVFVSRYLIFTVPAMYLLLGSLFESYTPKMATAFRVGLVVLMLITLGIEIVNPTTPVKEDYMDAAQYITAHATAQDVVVLSAPFTVYPVQYYYRGDAPLVTLPIWNQYAYGEGPSGITPAEIPGQVQTISGSSQTLWLLLSYDQGYQKDIQTYFDTHYEQLQKKNFSAGLILYQYKLRYDTSKSIIPSSTPAQ